MSRGHIIVFFNRHCSTMNLVKEKQGWLVPPGLKRWPFKLIKHFGDTTSVSPSPAGPAGCCPLNFLNLINLKFRVRAPNGSCIARKKRTLLSCIYTIGNYIPSNRCEGVRVRAPARVCSHFSFRFMVDYDTQ